MEEKKKLTNFFFQHYVLVHIKVNHLIQYGRHRRHFLLANIRFFTQEPQNIRKYKQNGE